MAGRFDQARADTERGLALARGSHNVEAIAVALLGVVWARQRDDPEAALTAAEEYLQLHRAFDVNAGGTASLLAIAGGLRARLGDTAGALEWLHDAVVVARDLGVRPQLAATLDYALAPLLRFGRPEIAAALLGALTDGALAGHGGWPGVAAARAKALDRARTELGDQLDTSLARGTAMSYDELVEYAIEHLRPPSS